MLGVLCVCFPVFILLLLYFRLVFIGKLQSLNNKHVVITGGTSGIGKATAINCLKRGANVTIIARNEQILKNTQNELQKYCTTSSQTIKYAAGDVTNATQIENIIQAAHNEEPIFMLVNCAGKALYDVLEDMPLETISSIIDLNLMGTIFTTRAVMPLMKLKNEGIVVITASQGALLGVYGGAAYTASKFGLRGLAEVLYFEGKPYNVSITLSLPSDTDTPGFANEELTKPLETKLICEQGGLLEPSVVAEQLVIDALVRFCYLFLDTR